MELIAKAMQWWHQQRLQEAHDELERYIKHYEWLTTYHRYLNAYTRIQRCPILGRWQHVLEIEHELDRLRGTVPPHGVGDIEYTKQQIRKHQLRIQTLQGTMPVTA